MAITSQSQVLNLDKVYNATANLDTAAKYLKNVKSILTNAESYCNQSVFETNEGNAFPNRIKSLQSNIDTIINKINLLKSSVNSAARTIHYREQNEYDQYIENWISKKDSV